MRILIINVATPMLGQVSRDWKGVLISAQDHGHRSKSPKKCSEAHNFNQSKLQKVKLNMKETNGHQENPIPEEFQLLHRYWQASNYLSVGQVRTIEGSMDGCYIQHPSEGCPTETISHLPV